ncbi:hypothetical protein M0802_004597 [Mischocyttarus mexicanus]|nr:hypothetical protein M0802_004597 [Mischocyttarus mexicanus]
MSIESVSDYICYLIRHYYNQLVGFQHDIKKLVLLAFSGSIGMTLVILGCALPQYEVWWPFFVVLFYVLAPIPTIIARRYSEDSPSSSNPCLELAIFITIGFVIQPGACYLTLAGNVIVYLTLVGFFVTFEQDDVDYNMW